MPVSFDTVLPPPPLVFDFGLRRVFPRNIAASNRIFHRSFALFDSKSPRTFANRSCRQTPLSPPQYKQNLPWIGASKPACNGSLQEFAGRRIWPSVLIKNGASWTRPRTLFRDYESTAKRVAETAPLHAYTRRQTEDTSLHGDPRFYWEKHPRLHARVNVTRWKTVALHAARVNKWLWLFACTAWLKPSWLQAMKPPFATRSWRNGEKVKRA